MSVARAAAVLLMVVCSGVHAQAPAPATAADEANALILEGLKLREQGQDRAALPLFERAYQLAPTPRALAQRALAEQALGAWVPAETHLREAVAATSDPWIIQNQQALSEALAVIGTHLGYLQVNSNVAGAELRIDGQYVGQLPLAAPMRLIVGRPLLELTAAGHYPVRREITIKAGALSTESIELVSVPAEPPAASAEDSTPAPAIEEAASDRGATPALSPLVFFAAAGVTAALGGVTVWSALNTKAKNDAYEEYSARPSATPAESLHGLEDAEDAQQRTNILLAGTGVAAAATLVIGVLFTDWSGGSSESDALALRATVYSRGADHGLLLERRF
jgi:hypothetical protein